MRTKPVRIRLDLLENLKEIDKDVNSAISKLLDRSKSVTNCNSYVDINFESIEAIANAVVEKIKG